MEAIEVVEAAEVIVAIQVLDAKEITLYVKCKLSFSPKRHKKAKNVEKIFFESGFTFCTFKLF